MTSRQQLIANEADHPAVLPTAEGIGGKAYEDILKTVRGRQHAMTTNCACDDTLVPPTLADELGIAAPLANTVAQPGEFHAEGYCDDIDAVVPLTLNFDGQDFAGHTGRAS